MGTRVARTPCAPHVSRDPVPTIAIFGISGRLGRALTVAARSRAWPVRGFGRISSTMPVGATCLRGRYDEPGHLREVVRGADAVCCVFGPASPSADPFCADATAAVIAAMTASGVTRLLCVTGAMIGTCPSRSRAMKWFRALYRRRWPAEGRDRDRQEAVVAESGLDWTIVKPPRLSDRPPRGRTLAGTDLRVGMLSSVTRADLARFLMEEIATPRFLRSRVIVRNGR